MKGILDSCWFGRNFLTGWMDLLLILMPHLLIFSIKRLEKSRAKENEKPTLMDLPNDFLFDVFARLPVKSLCHIRSVSKTSLSIVDNPFFATLRLLNPATNTAVVELPQLMLLTHSWSFWPSDRGRFALQSLKYRGEHNLTKSKHRYSQILYQRYEFDFVFCNLFCFKAKYGCLLVNPLREEVLDIELPINDLVRFHAKKWYGMGFDSVTRTHKIVCVFKSTSHDMLEAYVYTLGTRSLSRQKIHSVPQCEFSSNNVSAYGDMHWLIHRHVAGGNPNRIISFNFEKDEFVWTPYPDSSRSFNYNLNNMRLLNVRGCLAIMSYQHSSIDIWVMKNYEKKVWELDYKIDNKRFPHYPRSIETCGEWEHGIFFSQRYPNMFYFWDVRDKSIKHIKAETLLPGIFSYDTLQNLLWDDEWRQLRVISIFSYTDSLISLKTFGNLVERQVCRGQNRVHGISIY